MRPGSKIVGIRPADAKTARNNPKPYRKASSDPCTPRTRLLTSVARLSLPKSDMVASAPSTTSIFMRKMKNRITAVEQPKNPQKILRAKASRNVSRTRAAVAKKFLSLIDRLHEHVFKSADGARHRLDGTLLGA